MKRFQFRLATLLRLREALRDERRAQLADAFRVEEVLTAQRGELAAQLQEARRQQTSLPGIVDVDRILAAQRHEAALMMEQNALDEQQAHVAAEIERRREALVAADQDVRVLEKLREAQFARWRGEEERQSIKMLDEVASRTWRREAG